MDAEGVEELPTREWLDSVRRGWGAKYGASFEAIGLDLVEDFQACVWLCNKSVRVHHASFLPFDPFSFYVSFGTRVWTKSRWRLSRKRSRLRARS